MSHRRPPGPAAARPGSRRPVAGRPMRMALVSALVGAALLGSATPAYAVPPPPPNPTDSELGSAAAQQQAAAAEVGRMQGMVAAAEAELQRVGQLAEVAGAAYMAAEEALMLAQVAAERTAAELAVAAEAVAASEARIALFSRDSYMNGGSLSSSAALLDAEGPGELIQRAAMLDYVAENQLDVLGALEVAKVAQANADSAARAARDEMVTAEEVAEAAKAEADAQLDAQQGSYERIAADKAAYDQQLQAAQIRVLELQGARNAFDQWSAQKRAEEEAAAAAAARAAAEAAAAAQRARANPGPSGGGGSSGGGGVSGFVKPFSGRVTSCFGDRWGTTHFGLDVASPTGTPLYAPIAGRIERAGAATGFGLAVYLRGDDGAVYVYGHINDYFVRAGDRVVAGEQIAEVGNTGISTGSHVHFEVHPSGAMYSGAVNPVPWLNARGVTVGGCGG